MTIPRIAYFLGCLHTENAHVGADIDEYKPWLQKMAQGRELRLKRIPENVNSTPSPAGAIVSLDKNAVRQPCSQKPTPRSDRNANLSEKNHTHEAASPFDGFGKTLSHSGAQCL